MGLYIYIYVYIYILQPYIKLAITSARLLRHGAASHGQVMSPNEKREMDLMYVSPVLRQLI